MKFTVALEQMRAHYAAAMQLYQDHQPTQGAEVASHSRTELYPLIQNDMNPALQKRFLSSHNKITQMLSTKGSLLALQGAANTFNADADAALLLIPAALRRDPKFSAQVISTLLKSAGEDYTNGVAGSRIKDLVEYQDALQFLMRAQTLFDQNAARFPSDQGGQTRAALEQARKVMTLKDSPTKLNVALNRARGELAEISGIALIVTNSSTGIDTIIALLQSAKANYRQGKIDAANEAVISTYLDHFEALETPLVAKDKPLELQLEATLKTRLRDLIRSKVSAAVFAAAVDRAVIDLQKARGLL